ncbi:MAG TPA: GNAT family N-acetyltransferase [Mycobacteriales bacterium]|nr:GNAT family N-acetyltransferase [Mycobacteriales bacterium]
MSAAPASSVVVEPEPYDGETARALLAALDADLDERYPGEGIPPPVLDPADFRAPRGAFLVARQDGDPIGCGALRPGPVPGTGEVKRMYVAPRARGRRVAERVLERLAAIAVDLGYTRLVLETGLAQPEALRLYERLGWEPAPAFGHYRDSPLSRCYGRDLT